LASILSKIYLPLLSLSSLAEIPVRFFSNPSKMMKALQIALVEGKPALSLTSLPKPSIRPGYVLVKVNAAAINPSDFFNTKGGFAHTTFPRVPGRDFAGVVVEPESSPLIQKAVFGSSAHDMSFTEDGAHAEYVLVREASLATKPTNLSFAQAASVGVPYTTAFLALKRAHTLPEDTVMVLGATGAVGTAATQLAKQMGCKVLTVSRRDTSSINLTKDPTLSATKELTNDKGPNVVIDTIGDTVLMSSALQVLAVGGRLSFISVGQSKEAEFKVDMKKLYSKEQSIVGSSSLEHEAVEVGGWLRHLVPMFEKGELQSITEKDLTIVEIDDALAAYESVGKRAGGKYVIEFP
jgi:NADPH:quinone reductase